MVEGEEKAAWEGTDIGECQFKNDLTYLEDSQGAALPPPPGGGRAFWEEGCRR